MMRMEERRIEGLIVLGLWASSLLLCGSLGMVAAAETGLANECSNDFQSLMICLGFAQGKVATPTKECCSTVSSIKENNPKCLCYILQQTQTPAGAEKLKGLGVEEAKILELPSACQLKNASVTECPKLLGLSPNSPDAAIFSNSSAKTKTATPASTGDPTSASEKSDSKSGGTQVGTHLLGSTLLTVSAIFIYAFPAGFASLF